MQWIISRDDVVPRRAMRPRPAGWVEARNVSMAGGFRSAMGGCHLVRQTLTQPHEPHDLDPRDSIGPAQGCLGKAGGEEGLEPKPGVSPESQERLS